MLEELKHEANYTLTENLALTHKSTLSDCLDLFATIGALRNSHPGEIITRFMRAFTEDRDMAAKIAFYGRDIRGGLGERRTFRVILQWLAENSPSTISKNISLIPEYGRYDDILELLGTKCEQSALSLIASQLKSDMESESPSLLAKWLPSVNASSSETRYKALKIAKSLGMSLKDYTFDYSKQPSQAMFKYRAAFSRNDNERYMAFLDDVSAGKATLHTGTLTPYEIIRPILDTGLNADEINAINTTWNAQEDFTNGENAIVVVDGSGSMYGGRNVSPISVALSLGIYFAERNKGEFHNHFITFSMTPQLVEIKGANIYEKVRYCASFNEAANTNVQAVFELILSTAMKHNVPQSELPSTIYIISDMEFDYCNKADITNFEYAKKIFAEHGYKLPNVVFWNVESRNTQQPVTMNEQGVTLVSGASPRVFAMIKSGNLSPMSFMLDVLNSERYRNITA